MMGSIRQIAVLGIRLVVGGVFVAAAYHKILDPASFAQAVYFYHMVPASLLHFFAVYLPWLELVAGLALITGLWRYGAALLSALMTLMFILALTLAMSRGLDISCGCFDTDGGQLVSLDLLVRDVILLGGILLLMGLDRPEGQTT